MIAKHTVRNALMWSTRSLSILTPDPVPSGRRLVSHQAVAIKHQGWKIQVAPKTSTILLPVCDILCYVELWLLGFQKMQQLWKKKNPEHSLLACWLLERTRAEKPLQDAGVDNQVRDCQHLRPPGGNWSARLRRSGSEVSWLAQSLYMCFPFICTAPAEVTSYTN